MGENNASKRSRGIFYAVLLFLLTNFGDTSEVQAVRFTIDLFAKSALISIRTS